MAETLDALEVPSGLVAELLDRAVRMLDVAAAASWRGSDPYDGLWWRWPWPLVACKPGRQAIAQLHARSPIDFRGVYRREQPPIPKAQAIFASTALKLDELTGQPRLRMLAVDALEHLCADRTAGPRAWGYHWDMQTRWSFYPAGSPNVVVTAFAVDALTAAGRRLGDERYAERAHHAGEWVVEELWREDQQGFAYHPNSSSLIHNANLLGALAAWQALPHEEPLRARLRAAVQRTLRDQGTDGSWPYGADANLGFVDSFHTGYVLRCLVRLRELHPDVDQALARGADYYCRRFFAPSGAAHLWPDRRFPEDGHSVGTALTTLSLLAHRGLADPDLIRRVARRALNTMIVGDHAVFRRYRWGRSRVHFVRWCDAHVAQGLADAVAAVPAEPSSRGSVPDDWTVR